MLRDKYFAVGLPGKIFLPGRFYQESVCKVTKDYLNCYLARAIVR